jgi:hypothetical protein
MGSVSSELCFVSFESLLNSERKFQHVRRNDFIETSATVQSQSNIFSEKEINIGRFRDDIGVYFDSKVALISVTIHLFLDIFDDEVYKMTENDFVGKKLFLSLNTILFPNALVCPFNSVPDTEVKLLKHIEVH